MLGLEDVMDRRGVSPARKMRLANQMSCALHSVRIHWPNSPRGLEVGGERESSARVFPEALAMWGRAIPWRVLGKSVSD